MEKRFLSILHVLTYKLSFFYWFFFFRLSVLPVVPSRKLKGIEERKEEIGPESFSWMILPTDGNDEDICQRFAYIMFELFIFNEWSGAGHDVAVDGRLDGNDHVSFG